jgi:Sec-independent protein translocase protein TatA
MADMLAIVVVFFMWGPKKLSEFARSLGEARRIIREVGDPKEED